MSLISFLENIMTRSALPIWLRLATLSLALGTLPVVHAQTTPPVTDDSAVQSSQVPLSQLVTRYSAFVGDAVSTNSLVNGLRTGGSITLGVDTVSVTFASPVSKLGLGEINLALSLAQSSLAEQGILAPTPIQLQSALTGMNGVLTQRAAGLGWGQIAQSMGVTLGSIVSASHTKQAHAVRGNTAKNDKDNNAGTTSGQSKGQGQSGGNSGGSGGGHGGGNGGGRGR